MVDVLDAVLNYAEMSERSTSDLKSSENRINTVGDGLEFFTMDLFCSSLDKDSKDEKRKEYSKHLSWLGTKNHPPDFIIEGAEAFEVKKKTSKAGQIQLNSSFPHQKLKKTNNRITRDCKTCEDDIGGWDEKDLVYVIGRVPSGSSKLDFMWMVYGDCWSAKDEVYRKLADNLSDKINQAVGELEHGNLSEQTNEIGKVHDADPLGRTKLRIRGMWLIEHPAKYFSQYIENYDRKITEKQPLFVVLRKERFKEFNREKRETLMDDENIGVKEVDIPNPDNPAKRIKAIIIQTGV